MSVTMREVADKANVSLMTVSRVVNNRGEISEATRQRVLAVIEKLGYRPNALARGLVVGKTLSVGMIIPQITDPFFPEVVLGAERVAHSQHYSVFLCNTSEDPQQELHYINVLASKQVDGIILCGTCLRSAQLSEVAAHHRIVVLTDRKPEKTSTIGIQAEQGMYAITSHMIRLGHRTIGFVNREEAENTERLTGYQRALAAHGIDADPAWHRLMNRASVTAGRQGVLDLMNQVSGMTAILCYDDQMAYGAVLACRELGLRVPEDIAVGGFDDIPLASQITPALTTMHIDRYRLGEMLIDLLLRVIAAERVYEEHLAVVPDLIIRESCGANRSMRPM